MSTVVFDLDGTLIDSMPGIVASLRDAYTGAGLTPPPDAELRTWIGPPMRESLRLRGGLPEADVERVHVGYRAAYDEAGVLNSDPYPFVVETLERLHDAGLRLAVATSKPHAPTLRVLEHLDLARHFAYCRGAELDGPLNTKTAILADVLRTLGADPAGTAMIGDRHHDIDAARELGTLAVFAQWGYGPADEAAHAHVTVADLPALGRALLERAVA